MTRTQIPAIDDCHFDSFLYVICSHPEADDSFPVSGHGVTRPEAYCNMLEDLHQRVCDDFATDEEATAHYAEIQAIIARTHTEAYQKMLQELSVAGLR